MQKIKRCTGTTSPSSTKSYNLSYGITKTESLYASIIEKLNNEIAIFLHDDCGVDAAYESRGTDKNSYLWIYGVPFFFMQSAVSQPQSRIYGPFNADKQIIQMSGGIFPPTVGAVYNFFLIFCGNPETGFILRITPNQTGVENITSFSGFTLGIMKGRNFLTDRDSVIWNGVTTTFGTEYYGCDMNSDNIIDGDYFIYERVSSNLTYSYRTNEQELNPSIFPLMPLMVGPWKMTKIYSTPTHFSLVPAQPYSSITQSEMIIGDRRFLVTYPNGINAPIIELDD